MTEMNSTRWLIFLGILGVAIPWVVHWSYQNLGFLEAFPMIYVTALWAGAFASLIAAGGGCWQMSRWPGYPGRQWEAAWAFVFGAIGLGSLVLVMVLGMM